ncbi:MAG: VIT and vWA domain-containing protein [Desulfatiglandales bacterium]
MNETYGLLSCVSGTVPLVGVKAEGDILGRGARVKVSQRFRNQEKKAIEAVYKFPLPEAAAVCGFRAVIDGKEIRGQVEERDRAFELYDDALSRGDGGYLLDEERPNIFTLSVGNLNPGTEVMVETEYVTLLDMEGREVRFSLPTTISPRYIPEGMEEEGGIPESGRVHPPYADSVPYGLSISLHIHNGRLLKSIDSPSHPVRVGHLKGDPVEVTFSAQSVRMDRDFILNVEYEESSASMAYRHRVGRETFFQLDLFLDSDPEGMKGSTAQDHKDAMKEIIFLLDCSGSMSGDSIQEAKKALEICLRGLEPKTAFTIYCFGSGYHRLFNRPGKYSEASLKKGLAYLRKADADLGGTEIMNPLKEIFATRKTEGETERNIVLLTDGEVGNEEEIFELVAENQESTRVFSIGIGAGCNEYFIKGLSRVGRGASEFIYPGERIEPKVLRLFGKIMQKGLDNPLIHWGEGALEQAPAAPVIFLDSPVTVFARFEDQDFSTEQITVKGRVNGEDREWVIPMAETRDSGVPVPILWAGERIRDLEERGGAPGERGSRQKERKGDQRKEAVLELSKAYNILSRSTSYVAVEAREEKDKATGELVLRKIPVAVTMGWHGMGSVFGLLRAKAMYSMAPPGALVCETQFMPAEMSFDRSADAEADYGVFYNPEVADESRTDIVLGILSLQKAEGGMELDEEVSQNLGLDHDQIAKIALEIEVDTEVDRFLLVSTAIVIQTLEIRFASERETWAGVIRKSRDWITRVLEEGKPRIHGGDLMTWAEEFVRDNVLTEQDTCITRMKRT